MSFPLNTSFISLYYLPMSLLAVEINDVLLVEFRKFAVEKHGTIYRALRPEVELALRRHLESERKPMKRTAGGKT